MSPDSYHVPGSNLVWSCVSCGKVSKDGKMTGQRAIRLFPLCFLHHCVILDQVGVQQIEIVFLNIFS